MVVWSISFGLIYCIVCPFLSFKGRFWMAGWLTYPVFFALKWLCGLTYSVEGRENLPAGNHVIFMKHSSAWETYGIMILFPPHVWVMKREILWIPFVGWGCMLARCIAIDRKAGASGGEPGARARQGSHAAFRRLGHGVPRGHAHGGGRDPPLRLERHVVSGAGRLQDRARGAQCGLFLAAARTAQETRHHPRRSSDRPSRRRAATRARSTKKCRHGSSVTSISRPMDRRRNDARPRDEAA